MSKTTLKERTALKLDEYIGLRKAACALYELAEATDYEDFRLEHLVEDIVSLATEAGLAAFDLAARSRDASTIHKVVKTLRDYGNDWLFDELTEDLFGEDDTANRVEKVEAA